MPSTYTLNNGIELIATGEQSGTWGDTTNTNLSLVDTALDGQVTVTLPSAGTSGSPNTLAISDGAASDGRNRMVIFNDGGDLGATAYVQLTPNDAEKIIYVRNDLAGSRSIILFQGTYNASNDYELPAGTTAVIYFDGAGSGAVAANVFNNAYFDSLRLGSVSVTEIIDDDTMATAAATNIATSESIKAYVDAQVGANNELSEVLANGNTSGGTAIQMTTTDELQFRDTALKISSSADGQLDIDADTEIEIVAPTVDIDASTAMTIDTAALTVTGAVDFNTSLNVDGTVTSDGLTVDGAVAINGTSAGQLTIDATGQYGQILFQQNSGNNSGGDIIYDHTSDQLWLRSLAVGGINLKTSSTAGSAIDRLTVSYNGDISFFEDTGTTAKFFWDASAESLGIGTSSPATDAQLSISAPDAPHIYFERSTSGRYDAAIGMPSSADIAFYNGANSSTVSGLSERMRIDGNGNVMVGGTVAGNAATISLNVGNAGSTNGGLQLWGTTTGTHYIQFGDESGTAANHYRGYMAYAHNGDSLRFATASTERMRIDGSGNVSINSTNAEGAKLKVEDTQDAVTYPLFLQNRTNTGNSAVGIRFIATGSSVADGQFAAIRATNALGTGSTANDLEFLTCGSGGTPTVRMNIDSSGNVIATSGSLNLVGTNTQMFASSNGDDIQFKFSGVKKAQINNSGLISSSDGNATVPGFRFVDDANTGMFRATTDTIGFSAGGAEIARIDAAGNLMVGGTNGNPIGNHVSQIIANGANGLGVHRDGGVPFKAGTDADRNIIEVYKQGALVGSLGVDNTDNLTISGNSSHCGLNFSTDDVNPYKNGAYTNGTTSLGTNTTRFKDLYLSGGVYLGGTGSANQLDDYEEGVFDISFTMSGSGTVTPKTGFDRIGYTKIGRVVHIIGNPRIGSVSSPTGELKMTLPFTAKGGAIDENRSGNVINYYRSGFADPYHAVNSTVAENTSLVNFHNQNRNLGNFAPAANDELILNFFYFTAT